MTPRLIATIVPPWDFDRWRWLVPVGVPNPGAWHYGLERGERHQGSTSVDLGTVDPPLRELVGRLNAAGLATLPSCLGHHGWNGARICRAAGALRDQAEALRGPGLVLEDVEDGSRRRVRVPDWAPPSASDLRAGARATMGQGYLGVLLPEPRLLQPLHLGGVAQLTERAWALPGRPGTRRLDIRVHAPTPRAQREAWDQVDRIVDRILRDPPLHSTPLG